MTDCAGLSDTRSFRAAALANDYPLVRVRSRAKAPLASGWQNGEADETLLNVTEDAANTGLNCRGFRVIDTDVDDPRLVSQLIGVAADCLPVGALIRRRPGSPRVAMVYRSEGTPGKLSISGDAGKIEILGAGQQLVIDGFHPSGQRLTWEHDRSPATVAAGDVPVVSESQIETFLSACSAILGTERVTSRGNLVQRRDLGLAKEALENDLAAGIDRWHWFDDLVPSGKREVVEACLDAIDNRQHDPRPRWLSIVFAVADAETRGCPDARELCREWSKRGAGWTSESDFDTAWNSFKPGGTTVGTVIYMARRAGADLTAWQKDILNQLGQAGMLAQTTSTQPEASSYADPYAEFVGPKFPISILPSVLADYVVAEHKAMGADPSVLAMASLAAVGAALTSETKVQVGDGWYERPILWVAAVGEPSTMKSPVITKTTKPLFKIDNDADARWRIAKSTCGQQKAAGNPPGVCPAKPPRCIIQDATPEKTAEILARGPAGSLMVQDELAGWMASFDRYGSGASSRAFYLSAFNGGTYLKDRVGKGTRDDEAEIRVENLALNILGGIQPDRLSRLRDLTSDGLLQRFLVILMAAPLRGNQKHPVNVEEANFAKLVESVHATPVNRYRFAADAEPILDRVLDRLYELEQVAGFSSALIGAIGKFRGYYARLALVLHVAEEQSALIKAQPTQFASFINAQPTQFAGVISKETAERCEQLVFDFLLPHTFGLYDVVANGGQDRDTIRAIGDFILASDKDRLRPSDITTGVRRLRNQPANKIVEWASRFCALGWLQPEDERGPVPKAWLVDPGLRTYFAARRRHAQVARAAAHEILKAGGTRR